MSTTYPHRHLKKKESLLHLSSPQSFSFSPFQFPHVKTKKSRNKLEVTIEDELVTRSGGEERNRKGKSPEFAAESPGGIAGGCQGLQGRWTARREVSLALASAGTHWHMGRWFGSHAAVRSDVRRLCGIARCGQRRRLGSIRTQRCV
jgi:hypothetical protein